MVARDKPRVWHLATVSGDAKAELDRWMTRSNDLEHDDVADEQSRQIVTSEPFDGGKTHSLHDLLTDDRQRFHIHLPYTPTSATRDASLLKEPASHRYLMIATGEKPGLFEWADAKGPINVDTQAPTSIATGEVNRMGYRAVIPPYSIYCIELMGGIHHFHNIRGFSFHRENLPSQGDGDDLTLNTQQWHGKLPPQFLDLKPTLIFPGLDEGEDHPIVGKPLSVREPDVLRIILGSSEALLANFTRNTKLSDRFDQSPYFLTSQLYTLAAGMAATQHGGEFDRVSPAAGVARGA